MHVSAISLKCVKFIFSPYRSNGVHLWTDFCRFGELINVEVYEKIKDPMDFPFTLNPDEIYQIGLDQSTSCTGIFIKNFRNTEVYMMEYKANSVTKPTDATSFLINLEMFLHNLCKGTNISHTIYEATIESDNYRTSKILAQLAGIVEALPLRYNEFKTTVLDDIANQSWRESVICEEFCEYDRKEQSMLSIQKIFPWTINYGNSLSSRDVYEAMGILFGWFMKSFDKLGRPYVRGTPFSGNVGIILFPNMSGEEVCNQINSLGIEIANYKVYNFSLSIFKNIVCSVSKEDAALVEITDKFVIICMCAEANIKIEDYNIMTALVVRESCDYAKSIYSLAGGFMFYE